MAVITPARRVATFDALERAGDYFGPTVEVDNDEKPTGRRGVWFLLPIHTGDVMSRAEPGSGLHRVSEPPWTFRECGDGSLEIRASIRCGRGLPGYPNGYWHGFLDEGNQWRQV